MGKLINMKTLRYYSYFDITLVTQKVKGIVIEFTDLGPLNEKRAKYMANKCAEQGVLYISPFLNPWSWLDKNAVVFVEELLDVLYEYYGLNNPPIVLTGESMGGLSALVCSVYLKRNVLSCVVNCPVCDIHLHYNEEKDLPTKFSKALSAYDSIDRALCYCSPMAYADAKLLPNISYVIYHSMNDSKVNIDAHSLRLYEFMKKNNYDIEVYKIPLCDHCVMNEGTLNSYISKILKPFNNL